MQGNVDRPEFCTEIIATITDTFRHSSRRFDICMSLDSLILASCRHGKNEVKRAIE